MEKSMLTQRLNPKIAAGTALLLALFLAAIPRASAQAATPVPTLDLTRLIGTYYEIARYPIRRERLCLSKEMVLDALGDKQNSLQIVTVCQVKEDFTTYWNKQGKLDNSNNGKIKLNSMWPFYTKYWVLAIAPDYSWALVGTPNHKSLWILSRSPTLPADVLAGIQSQATAQGYDIAKLIKIPQESSVNVSANAPQ
jgi:apolipoprotein D and lipocalin family protein